MILMGICIRLLRWRLLRRKPTDIGLFWIFIHVRVYFILDFFIFCSSANLNICLYVTSVFIRIYHQIVIINYSPILCRNKTIQVTTKLKSKTFNPKATIAHTKKSQIKIWLKFWTLNRTTPISQSSVTWIQVWVKINF